jgi:tRNA 2-thiouridine synthesizing protein E
MKSTIISGSQIDLSDDEYFTDPMQWSPAIGAEIAASEGILLTEIHLKVILFLRARFMSGEPLTIRCIKNSGITDLKTFYSLFPGAALKRAAKIAGLPKPANCI